MSLNNNVRKNDYSSFSIGAPTKTTRAKPSNDEAPVTLRALEFDEPEMDADLDHGLNGTKIEAPKFDGKIGAGGPALTVKAQPQDTLIGIGRRYGVSFGDMKAANPDLVANMPVGATVKIPGWELHTVTTGDTLYSLSNGNKDVQKTIREVNDLEGNTLPLGKVIHAPASGPSRPAKTSSTPPTTTTNANEGKTNNPIRTQKPARPSQPANDETVRHKTADGTFYFPVGGEQFNVGYDDNWNTWGSDRLNNSDFGAGRGHKGNDIFGPKGAPIVAAVSGKVVNVSTPKTNKLGGNAVTIEDANGNRYYYAHLTKANVKVGQQITAGSTIGTLGNTGSPANKTQPHLHFEIWQKPANKTHAERSDAIDPFSKLEAAINGD